MSTNLINSTLQQLLQVLRKMSVTLDKIADSAPPAEINVDMDKLQVVISEKGGEPKVGLKVVGVSGEETVLVFDQLADLGMGGLYMFGSSMDDESQDQLEQLLTDHGFIVPKGQK